MIIEFPREIHRAGKLPFFPANNQLEQKLFTSSQRQLVHHHSASRESSHTVFVFGEISQIYTIDSGGIRLRNILCQMSKYFV